VNKFFDIQVAFFIPIWRRIVAVVLILGWGIFELVAASPMWGAVFSAAGLYCAHQFFIAFDPPPDKKAVTKEDEPSA